jgi:hypothetical protein
MAWLTQNNTMNSKLIIIIIALLIGASVHAQQTKDSPHKFKELKIGATLEVVREHNVVNIYMLIDDIEQYDEILVERSDEQQKNYSQCKEVKIEKGKYKNNYVELVDHYPLSPKMSNLYRIKAITAEGIMKMFPPVPITMAADEARK